LLSPAACPKQLWPARVLRKLAYFRKQGGCAKNPLLEEFYSKIDAVSDITAPIDPKKKVFFEFTETNYHTVTTDSMPARAIEFAGGVNIAIDAEPITEGSSIDSYVIENILINADIIDVYISQRGAMNAGGNTHSIAIREGSENIKAVQNGDILEINEKLVSSPTFRYYKVVNEITRAVSRSNG
jgi:iron complex transport system substrate-binding protein